MKMRARHSGFFRLAAVWRPWAAAPPAGAKIPDAAAYTHEDSLFLRQADSLRRQPLLDRAAYVEGLKLQADEEACVAFDPGRNECLLSVADFNRGVEEWPSLPLGGHSGAASASVLPVASLRRSLLQALLDEAYLRYQLARDSAADSLEREWRSLKDRQIAAARREAGDSSLRSRYRRWPPERRVGGLKAALSGAVPFRKIFPRARVPWRIPWRKGRFPGPGPSHTVTC
jgi:hypothetical protein